MASNRGPGAVQPDYHRDSVAAQPYVGGGGVSAHSGSVGGSWGATQGAPSYSTPSITINTVPGPSTTGSGGAAVSDGTYERNLILELCPPGGLKPVPPPDKLANFIRSCSSLNSDLVCPVLLDCLEDGQPWIIRAKALCTMEAAIANGAKSDGSNPYRDFFFACRDEVSPLATHPRPPISEPARRVLKLLGVSADSIPSSSASPVPAAPPPNLLDFDDAPGQPATQGPPAPSSAPPPPPPPTSTGNNMFGGMQVKSSPAPPQHNQPTSTATPMAVPSTNLLDFDAPAAPSATTNDVFQSSTTSSSGIVTEPTAVSATSSMFDQLGVKDTDNKKGSDVTAVVSNGASAFGFLNATDTNTAPTPQSFDPLKNNTHTLTPNSAQKKMMEMSPEQIQAMAYQQMMMQQQQHIQMQMMMQQQMAVGGTGGVPMAVGMVGGGLPMYPPITNMAGVRRTPSLGSPNTPVMPTSFSFAPKPAQKDDKKFDFVKDAMAGHKK
jgi:hypothetical protein